MDTTKTLKRTMKSRKFPPIAIFEKADAAFDNAAKNGGHPKVLLGECTDSAPRRTRNRSKKAARETNLTPKQVEAAEAALAQRPNAAGEIPVVFNPKW